MPIFRRQSQGKDMRSIKQKIALAAGLGLIATAAILMAFGLYSTSNTKEFVSNRVSQLLGKSAISSLESLVSDRASVVETALQDNIDTARTTGKIFEVLRANLGSEHLRDLLLKFYAPTLITTPHIWVHIPHGSQTPLTAWMPHTPIQKPTTHRAALLHTGTAMKQAR